MIAYLGLGANLEDRAGNIQRAIDLLGQNLAVKVEAVSPLYETEPEGYKEQPSFLNAVCKIETELQPQVLLALAKKIERKLGREKTFRHGPRSIDIDILSYGELILDTEDLTIPHPRLGQRAFVLVPLKDIAARWRHPVTGKSVAQMLEEIGVTRRVRLWSKNTPVGLTRTWQGQSF